MDKAKVFPKLEACPCCGTTAGLEGKAFACQPCYDRHKARFPFRYEDYDDPAQLRGKFREYGAEENAKRQGSLKCAGCAALVCDCGAEVWNYIGQYNANGVYWCGKETGMPRREAVVSRADYPPDDRYHNGMRRGPVQRMTDPWHQFASAAQLPAPISADQPPACPLPWCARPLAAHTPEDRARCAEYAAAREEVIGRHARYVRELRVPAEVIRNRDGSRYAEPQGDAASWRRHAEQRMAAGLAALERRFKALTWVATGGE